MDKELELYNMPKSDYECWDKYPRYNWVYNTSRLLDAQHVKWSPFKTDDLPDHIPAFSFHSDSHLYYKDPKEPLIHSEAIIYTGTVKWLAHHKDAGLQEELVGEVDLRINAFATCYLPRFSGIVTFTTSSNIIYDLKLRPSYDLLPYYPDKSIKLIKKIFKKI